ncbi:MAG TPA: polyhydroxyalkanoate depolymerase, partial [Polyangiaceae bacterium]|nr:polyhydroxyalkanoate depolymerase [Polyangiaceae bacterium]
LLGPVSALSFLGTCAFSPPSPLANLPGGPLFAAGYELLYRVTKDYPKPAFDIDRVTAAGTEVSVVEQLVMQKPFCRLLHFKRSSSDVAASEALGRAPIVLVVAPLSGHHATLLRDTVHTLLADHDVYVTDWINARLVPLERGPFTLDDYVDYVRDFIRHIGAERVHVVSVCQPCVPVLGAAALLAAAGEPTPKSLILIGGPVDARRHPTQVNDLATTHSRAWFEEHLIQEVPSMYPGRGRRVYPGFLQHAGFIAMNPGRHMSSHWDFFRHLVDGDDEDAEAHRRFYDEYNAVIDLAAEYYLDCVRIVFQDFLLPRGKWYVHDQRVAPELLRDTALLTIEGERDDISGVGQTQAAQELCSGIPPERKRHLLVENVGHYGLFSGRRWRTLVYPRIAEFIGSQSR